MLRDDTDRYLPLTESTCYIMLTLVEPLHGYAVMKKVEEISKGTVKVGPGTLYGAFTLLEKEGLIVKVKEENRRKSYVLTPKGKKVLMNQIKRLEIMTQNGLSVMDMLRSIS
jgi:DNA-binding PadR family transcriptional regulator